MNVNFWAVLVSALVSMVIGSVWYGPLFGKKFMVAMGMDKWTPEHQVKMRKSMGLSFTLQFLASLVMFTVLAFFIGMGGELSTLRSWLLVPLIFWIGFVVPVKLGDAIWGGSWTLFWLAVSNMLVTLLVGGVIIGAW